MILKPLRHESKKLRESARGRECQMIGKRFSRLVVVKEVDRVCVGIKNVTWRRAFKCVCDCGNTVIATQLALNTENTRSCGCLRLSSIREWNDKNSIDWTGKIFHFLTVIGRHPVSIDGHRRWICRCDCGVEKLVKAKSKTRLAAKSCGCKAAELTGLNKLKHGLSRRGAKNPAYGLYFALTKRARDKDLPCDFFGNPEGFCRWFENRIAELGNKCPIFGTEFVVGVGRWLDESATVDRIIPSNGYVYGNIEIISHRANQIKNDASLKELEAICNYLYANQWGKR